MALGKEIQSFEGANARLELISPPQTCVQHILLAAINNLT